MSCFFSAVLLFIHFLASGVFSYLNDQEKISVRTQADSTLIFMSDTQSPLWVESLFIQKHGNEEATVQLFNSILADTSVATILHLGDVTGFGAHSDQWNTIDTFLTALKKKNIRMYATPGNHEYLLLPSKGISNFYRRFPEAQQISYTIRFGYVAIVLLNSNFSNLSKTEIIRQEQWYIQQLDSLEQDSCIDVVIVGCHHPPYTNNTIIGRSRRVEKEFVPPFLNHAKCKLFISGHSHAFEHFKNDTSITTKTQKDFIVIGGGGGLLHPLLLGRNQRWKDLYKPQTEYRMFHYIRGTLTPSGLALTVMMLHDGLSGPQPVYNLFLYRRAL